MLSTLIGPIKQQQYQRDWIYHSILFLSTIPSNQ